MSEKQIRMVKAALREEADRVLKGQWPKTRIARAMFCLTERGIDITCQNILQVWKIEKEM